MLASFLQNDSRRMLSPSVRVEDYLIPSIHWPFVIDNAANGNRALVVPDLSSTFLPPSPWKIRRPWCLRGFSAHSRPFLVSCLMCMVVRLSCHPGSYNLYMTLLFRFSTLLTRPHVSSMPFLFPYHTSLINSNSAVIPFFVLPLCPPFFSSVHVHV